MWSAKEIKMAECLSPFVYWGQDKGRIMLKVDLKEVEVCLLCVSYTTELSLRRKSSISDEMQLKFNRNISICRYNAGSV